MPHKKNTRFNLAQFMKDRKVAREKAVTENRKLLAEYKKVQRAQEKARGVFHLHGKTGCSGEKSNGTDFSTGNFSEKVENLQRYSSLTVFTEMIEKSCTICLVPLVPRFLARFLPAKLTTWRPI